MKTINKLVGAFFLFVVFMGHAQKTINIDDPTVQAVVGPGAPSPIDMYVYVLGAIAILFIAFYTKKYKTQKI
ncbi:hypothetical protein [Chryseobacterium sp. ERMR1:04]|uniref:hypothetical protein n=1 Tax=Chryseobacterium sp. ERMR1:04 TaxID=1705393 RepID=UPI0006C835F1|nr:hypothetical protein [Chryseobacterium sp. ERMR1:04]KPH11210.1 hypothetical protein AMQ68_17405 [Chryseobacterium sp. ERMR1:04]